MQFALGEITFALMNLFVIEEDEKHFALELNTYFFYPLSSDVRLKPKTPESGGGGR